MPWLSNPADKLIVNTENLIITQSRLRE